MDQRSSPPRPGAHSSAASPQSPSSRRVQSPDGRRDWMSQHVAAAQSHARSTTMPGAQIGAVGSEKGLGVQYGRSPPTSNSSEHGDTAGSSPPTSDPISSAPGSSYAFPPNQASLSPHVEPFSPNGLPPPSTLNLGSPSTHHPMVRLASVRSDPPQQLSPSGSYTNLSQSSSAQLFQHSAPAQSMSQSHSQSNLAALAQAQSLPPGLAERRPLYPNGIVGLSQEYDYASINGHVSALQSAAPISPPSAHSSAFEALRVQQAVAQQAAAQQAEEISTIFVVGFPDDMQERCVTRGAASDAPSEFQNMFTFSSGFEAATLKVPSKEPIVSGYDQFGNPVHDDDHSNGPRKQTIGFAKFRSRIEALDARDALSGRRVDAEKGNVLKAEMAKKNLHTRRGIAHDTVALAQMTTRDREREREPLPAPPNRLTNAFDAFHSVSPNAQTTPTLAPASLGHSLMQHIDSDQYPIEDPYANRPYGFPQEDSGNQSRLAQLSLGNLPQSGVLPTPSPKDQHPPINTLYVGGLPSALPSLSGATSALHLEDALRATFARCAGFRRLNFRQKSNGPMVFVEFEDVTHATRALNELYGNTLGGLVKSGIRLSYSKNPLGVQQPRNGSISGPSTGSPLSPSAQQAYDFNQLSQPQLPSQPYPAYYAQQAPRSTPRSSTTSQAGFSPFSSFGPSAAATAEGY